MRTPVIAGQLAPALSVSVAVFLSACGGGTPELQTPAGPTPSGSASAMPAPSGSATVPGVTPPAPSGTAAVEPGTVPSAPMKPIIASAMGEDLKKLGLDPKALPPLNKLPPEKLRQVMKTFSKSLGTQCTGCHDANDFLLPTPNKKIASKMWDLYVRGLATTDGQPLYCDSCHDGKKQFLDRHDKKALSAWMDANFVDKVKRLDGKEHSCATCHGEPFEPKFLAIWKR